jgi:hypothetical protein
MSTQPGYPRERLVQTLESLRFLEVKKTGRHIALLRTKTDGTRTPITIPNRDTVQESAIRVLCAYTGVPATVFQEMYRLAG